MDDGGRESHRVEPAHSALGSDRPITTASAKSGGLGGGDRIQATMVFEKLS